MSILLVVNSSSSYYIVFFIYIKTLLVDMSVSKTHVSYSIKPTCRSDLWSDGAYGWVSLIGNPRDYQYALT